MTSNRPLRAAAAVLGGASDNDALTAAWALASAPREASMRLQVHPVAANVGAASPALADRRAAPRNAETDLVTDG